MPQLFVVLILLSLVPPVGCQPTVPYTVTEHRDIAYTMPNTGKQDTLQRLNLVIPNKQGRIPLLIWIGGGAWSYGEKNQEMDLARKLGEQGVAVAAVGHRLSPAVWRDSSLRTGIQHPAHVQDVAAAVKWLYHHAGDYGVDSAALFIGGYSSGAHLAALISLDGRYLAQHGLSPAIFKGIIPVSGTYDIADYYRVLQASDRPALAEEHVEAVFGQGQDRFQQASPVHYLANLSVPWLLISDNNMHRYARLFEDSVRSTPFRHMQVMYAYDLSHGALWRNLSFEKNSIYRQAILHFITMHPAKDG